MAVTVQPAPAGMVFYRVQIALVVGFSEMSFTSEPILAPTAAAAAAHQAAFCSAQKEASILDERGRGLAWVSQKGYTLHVGGQTDAGLAAALKTQFALKTLVGG